MPWLTTKNRIIASGTSAISTETPQKRDEQSTRSICASAVRSCGCRLRCRPALGVEPDRLPRVGRMLQISRRDRPLTISVMMKSTRPISISACR